MKIKRLNRYKKEWYEKNKVAIRARHVQRVYGVSQFDIENTTVAQGGRCAICKRHVKLVVDHDHVTGKFRGMLCNKCNKGLGLFEDSIQFLVMAQMYLEDHIA